MKNKKTRSYNSIVRQKQAEETKNRIADAAEELIKSQGYENTTIGAIAQKAGVATQTVYAIFNSKQGILTHLLRRSANNIKMDVDFKAIIQTGNLPSIAKQIAVTTTKYGQEQISTLNSLGGFEILYPELYELINETSRDRRNAIEEGINDRLVSRGIKLTPAKKKLLTDIMWAFTDNNLYYLLVVEAGWPLARFESLFQRIIERLFMDIAPNMLDGVDD